MKAKLAVSALFFVMAIVCEASTTLGTEATITLPDETAALKASADPGFEKASTNCSICHSVDYITMQPRGKGRDFWTVEVNKMVGSYGCPVPAEDRSAIIDYLAKTY